MPIYEYQCNACGHQFEVLQKVTAAPIGECPECHAAEVQKLISAAAFKLTGTGWYETDFKKKSATATSSDTNACKTADCGKSSSTTDKVSKKDD